MKNVFSGLFGKPKAKSGSGTVQREHGDASTPEPAAVAATLQPSDDWKPGGVVLDDYKVIGHLGRGNFGHVYLLVHSQSTGHRFAVKRALIAGDEERRHFVDELKNWIDLPEHPHLVPCRFFRSLGNEIVIFADYVEGGDVAKWITAGKLNDLESILDVAIQFAWGLHAAHEFGVIHQDVKPSNALLTPQGVVRIADFGLARARSQPNAAAGKAMVAEYAGGYTEAYCAPEQQSYGEVSRRSDLWSWGVSVMEMLAGELAGRMGSEAPAQLEQLIRAQRKLANGRPAFPKAVIDVLRRCFQENPEDRWPTLLEAARALAASHQVLTGKAYPRTLPAFPQREGRRTAELDRRIGGATWVDPKSWLTEALTAVGRDPQQVERIAHSGRGMQSRRAQAIADLGNYQEAQILFEQAIASGRRDLRERLAALCIEKALVHDFVDDPSGALQCYDTGINIYDQLVQQEVRSELASRLAGAYLNKAHAVSALVGKKAALAFSDQSIAIYERLVNREGQHELAADLATAYSNKANTVCALGDHQSAVELCQRSIAIRERLVNHEGQNKLAPQLALAYVSQAVALSALGDNQGALGLYERSTLIYERLVHHEDRKDLAADLGRAYRNKAAAVSTLGDKRSAVALYERSIGIFEHLVSHEGRRELMPDLAIAYLNNGTALGALGDKKAALLFHGEAQAIYERLVIQEGRRELAADLAASYLSKAITVGALRDNRNAVALYDQAIAIYDRLIDHEGKREQAPQLANAHNFKANALSALGDEKSALASYQRSVAIYERLVNQEDRRDLALGLARTYKNLAATLSQLGKEQDALVLYEQAITIFDRLVNQEGRLELAGDLAWVEINFAATLKPLGNRARAGNLARKAIAILEVEVARTGRSDLHAVLNFARENLGDLL